MIVDIKTEIVEAQSHINVESLLRQIYSLLDIASQVRDMSMRTRVYVQNLPVFGVEKADVDLIIVEVGSDGQ